MREPSPSHRRAFLLTCVAPVAAAAAAPSFIAAAQRDARKRPPRPGGGRPLAQEVGTATFYSREFHGQKTASGDRYDEKALTAAHRSWAFGTVVRVTELESGRSVSVIINDRGPFGRSRRKGAVIDLSREAARRLKILDDGRARVRLEVLRWGKKTKQDTAGQ